MSVFGSMLRNIDEEGYLFKNQVSRAKLLKLKSFKKKH
jgi:hypothetical protein